MDLIQEQGLEMTKPTREYLFVILPTTLGMRLACRRGSIAPIWMTSIPFLQFFDLYPYEHSVYVSIEAVFPEEDLLDFHCTSIAIDSSMHPLRSLFLATALGILLIIPGSATTAMEQRISFATAIFMCAAAGECTWTVVYSSETLVPKTGLVIYAASVQANSVLRGASTNPPSLSLHLLQSGQSRPRRSDGTLRSQESYSAQRQRRA